MNICCSTNKPNPTGNITHGNYFAWEDDNKYLKIKIIVLMILFSFVIIIGSLGIHHNVAVLSSSLLIGTSIPLFMCLIIPRILYACSISKALADHRLTCTQSH